MSVQLDPRFIVRLYSCTTKHKKVILEGYRNFVLILGMTYSQAVPSLITARLLRLLRHSEHTIVLTSTSYYYFERRKNVRPGIDHTDPELIAPSAGNHVLNSLPVYSQSCRFLACLRNLVQRHLPILIKYCGV
jgi:hypothetical protein